eukprot:4383885-Pleurochrysis_carterae.AAC.2
MGAQTCTRLVMGGASGHLRRGVLVWGLPDAAVTARDETDPSATVASSHTSSLEDSKSSMAYAVKNISDRPVGLKMTEALFKLPKEL